MLFSESVTRHLSTQLPHMARPLAAWRKRAGDFGQIVASGRAISYIRCGSQSCGYGYSRQQCSVNVILLSTVCYMISASFTSDDPVFLVEPWMVLMSHCQTFPHGGVGSS